MGALPKRKTSTRRKGKRRASIKLTPKNLIKCQSCHELKEPHQACPHCGTYKPA